MKKYVLYKDFSGYKLTSPENYNAHIQDTNKIVNIRECWTISDAIRTVKYWMHLHDEQLIIIGK